EHDRNIFHRLVTLSNEKKQNKQHTIEMIIANEVTGIKEILNLAADVFTGITGDRCAVRVQTIEQVQGTDIEEAIIRTLARDVRSESHRAQVHYRVRDNSIYKTIFAEGKDLVIVEDINNF